MREMCCDAISPFTISLFTIESTNYEVRITGRALLLAKGLYAEALRGCGIRTHPPAPSQREGENLLVKVWHFKLTVLNHWLATLLICEKGIPLPFGKGLGDGLLASNKPEQHRTNAANIK